MSRAVRIEIPPDPGYLRLVRMLVAAFATEAADLELERAAVLRLAVSEACAAVLAPMLDDPAAGPVCLLGEVTDDVVVVEVRAAADRAAPWDLTVVRALVDEVAVIDEGDERVARLVVRAAAPV